MKQCMDAENLHRRLKKIIGQVQAIDRMIDEDVPCEDVLSQINAAKSALHGCGKVVLEGHIRHCVRDGIERQKAEKRADGGALGQNAGGGEERDDEGQDELHQKRDERHGKKAEAEAVEITLRREKRGSGVHGRVPPLSDAGRDACADQSARALRRL